MSDGAILAEETLVGKFIMTESGIEDVPLGEIQVGKFNDWMRPMASLKTFTAMLFVVEEEPTPSQLAW